MGVKWGGRPRARGKGPFGPICISHFGIDNIDSKLLVYIFLHILQITLPSHCEWL